MGLSRCLAAIGVLCSISGSSALRSTVSENYPQTSGVLLNTGVSDNEDISRRTFVAGNCGRLTVRDGLSVGESIKVTSNGWSDEGEDFHLVVVSDETPEMNKLKQQERAAAAAVASSVNSAAGEGSTNQAEQPAAPTASPEASSPAGGGPSGPPPEGKGGGDNEHPSNPDHIMEGHQEAPMIPFIGLNIPGEQSGKTDDGEGEEAQGKEASKKKPVVLVYTKDPDAPSETPLDSPAGPQTPFMVIFTKTSETETEVTLYTWLRSEQEEKTPSGTWHKASVRVGTGNAKHDLLVSVNDCQPKAFKVYASETADLLTAKAGMCNEPDPPLVQVHPEPLPPTLPNDSGEGTGAAAAATGSHPADNVAADNTAGANVSEA